MEHLGKLPPRETADALVYRCLDSMEPFLSKATPNSFSKIDFPNLDHVNSYYTRSNFQTRGINPVANSLTFPCLLLIVFGVLGESRKLSPSLAVAALWNSLLQYMDGPYHRL